MDEIVIKFMFAALKLLIQKRAKKTYFLFEKVSVRLFPKLFMAFLESF